MDSIFFPDNTDLGQENESLLTTCTIEEGQEYKFIWVTNIPNVHE